MLQFIFYIFQNGVDSESLKVSELPQIRKIKFLNGNSYPKFDDLNQAEGPFDSIFNLKRKSIIFSNIKLQKHKQRVVSPKNIKEIKEFTKIPFEKSGYDLTFIKAFHHINVGKIIKKKVKGVHFYNPDRTRIDEIIKKNEKTGVYIAKISKYDLNSNHWIEKDEPTNFFPDEWNLSKLFYELNFAYKNMQLLEGKVYMSKTTEGIPVKLIIDKKEIITIYPLL